MLLDVLVKVRQFGHPNFFLTYFAAEFRYAKIIHIVAKQYEVILSNKNVENMDWDTKMKNLKRFYCSKVIR